MMLIDTLITLWRRFLGVTLPSNSNLVVYVVEPFKPTQTRISNSESGLRYNLLILVLRMRSMERDMKADIAQCKTEVPMEGAHS